MRGDKTGALHRVYGPLLS